jgi:hypothetical protein
MINYFKIFNNNLAIYVFLIINNKKNRSLIYKMKKLMKIWQKNFYKFNRIIFINYDRISIQTI